MLSAQRVFVILRTMGFVLRATEVGTRSSGSFRVPQPQGPVPCILCDASCAPLSVRERFVPHVPNDESSTVHPRTYSVSRRHGDCSRDSMYGKSHERTRYIVHRVATNSWVHLGQAVDVSLSEAKPRPRNGSRKPHSCNGVPSWSLLGAPLPTRWRVNNGNGSSFLHTLEHRQEDEAYALVGPSSFDRRSGVVLEIADDAGSTS